MHMSTQRTHIRLNEQPKAASEKEQKRKKETFCKYHTIKENNSFADTNYVVVVVFIVLSPVCNKNSHEF